MINLSRSVESFRKIAKRSKYLVLARAVFPGAPSKSLIGSTHTRLELEQSLEYINRVYNDYFQYGKLTAADIQNKTILEIGPGDNLGVAIKLIAAGAKKVVALDKFYSQRDDQKQLQIYRAMIQSMGPDERRRVQQAVSLGEKKPVFISSYIQYLTGQGIDDPLSMFSPKSFDFIVSRAVLQYVEYLDTAFDTMHALLKPGGKLIHKIDLRDHGLLTDGGMNDLEFLTVSDFIWSRISPRVGKINRARVSYYREKLKNLGYTSQLFITHVIGRPGDLVPHPLTLSRARDYSLNDEENISEIRPRLLPRFKRLPAEDLLISGIFLVAQKPNN